MYKTEMNKQKWNQWAGAAEGKADATGDNETKFIAKILNSDLKIWSSFVLSQIK